jgi:hypothetical protein
MRAIGRCTIDSSNSNHPAYISTRGSPNSFTNPAHIFTRGIVSWKKTITQESIEKQTSYTHPAHMSTRGIVPWKRLCML